jgi:cell wall-associated NlpC family hydrolase
LSIIGEEIQKLSIKEKSVKKERTHKTETYEMVVKHVKRSAIAGLIGAAVIVAIAVWSVVMPYAVSIDGDTVCYVKNKEEAGQMTQAIIEEYLPEDATLNVVQVSDNITIERADLISALKADCVSVAAAADLLQERLENPDNYAAAAAAAGSKKVDPFGLFVYAEDAGTSAEETGDPAITLLSTSDIIENYKVPTEYVKDDTMLAGDSEVESKGKTGKREVLRQYTTVNGKVVKTDDLRVDILTEAKPKIIRKGTIGLPKDADWKTYDGDPVFNDGEVLITTAKKYLGAPYKYGGYSLTHGIDCVQFIRQMYAKYGISLPNGKNALKHVGFAVNYKDMRPGDIICYSNHYALYIGNGKIVHAIRKGVSVGNNPKYRGIVTIRRVVG